MTDAQPTDPQHSDSPQTTVLLADDQALLRAGFAMVIDSQPDLRVVAQAATGAEAIAGVRAHRVDIVLMDIRMPDLDGLEATRRIVAEGAAGRLRTPRIIVLTTFDTDEYAVTALRAGASGFLLKDAEPEVLLDAIRRVASGGAVLAPTTTRRLIDTAVLTPAEAPAPDPEHRRLLDSLTEREREILVAIASGATNTEIADHLVISESTVKSHVGRVLAKLDARDRVQAVVFAYDSGLVAPRG